MEIVLKSPHGVIHSISSFTSHIAQTCSADNLFNSQSSITLLVHAVEFLPEISILSRRKQKLFRRLRSKTFFFLIARDFHDLFFSQFPLPSDRPIGRRSVHSITIASDRASYDNYLLGDLNR